MYHVERFLSLPRMSFSPFPQSPSIQSTKTHWANFTHQILCLTKHLPTTSCLLKESLAVWISLTILEVATTIWVPLDANCMHDFNKSSYYSCEPDSTLISFLKKDGLQRPNSIPKVKQSVGQSRFKPGSCYRAQALNYHATCCLKWQRREHPILPTSQEVYLMWKYLSSVLKDHSFIQ